MAAWREAVLPPAWPQVLGAGSLFQLLLCLVTRALPSLAVVLTGAEVLPHVAVC